MESALRSVVLNRHLRVCVRRRLIFGPLVGQGIDYSFPNLLDVDCQS